MTQDTTDNTETMEKLILSVQRLEQDREMAWKNVHILEKARQEQDKKYQQCCQDVKDLQRQLASAEALIETLQEQLK